MKLEILKAFINGIRINFHGKKIGTKFIIFESDDWGAIRTPSKEAVEAFYNEGFENTRGIYHLDSLASEEDLACLFEVLYRHKGADGNPVRFTANAIMANPDFNKIEDSGFTEYYYESFTETFKRYPKHANNLLIWKEGIKNGIFQPQFHGREHLNIKRWLKALQAGDKNVHFCFKWNSTYSGKNDYSFMEAFDWDRPEDVNDHINILKDGIKIFEETFGYKSKTFIAPCYTWDTKLESELIELGIDWIQGVRFQFAPTGNFGQYHRIKHSFGEKNSLGIRFNIRNCAFEPTSNPNRDWVNTCLAQINAAFLMGKPAVISTHRINYIGFIEQQNRNQGIRNLNALLSGIKKYWPDAIFISTDQLGNYINDER